MPLRRRPRPDLRPNWRDPALPCIRDYTMRDGTRLIDVDPDYERRYRQHLMEISSHPTYLDDPTYNLRKPKT